MWRVNSYNIEAISEETTNKSIDVIIGRIRHKLGENPKEQRIFMR